jgi:hypothetical protein
MEISLPPKGPYNQTQQKRPPHCRPHSSRQHFAEEEGKRLIVALFIMLSLPLSHELLHANPTGPSCHCCGWVYYTPSAPENSRILFAIDAARKGCDLKVIS